MIISYAGTPLNDNEAMVSFFGAARIYNGRGRAEILRKRMVIEGEIVAATPTLIDQRVAQILSIFSLDGGTCQLSKSDGGATQFVIGAGSIAGCKIVEGPTFALQDGKAHYTTGLPFTVALEADYLSLGDGLVSYVETITRVGKGGPRRVVVELDNGLPQEQWVSVNTPVVVVQSGEAVGVAGYPSFNDPIYPAYVDDPDGFQTSTAAPRLESGVWLDWPIRWNYRMTLPASVTVPYPFRR